MSDLLNAELALLIAKLRRFVAERDWSRFHDPKNLAMAVASEAGELLSELRWVSNPDSDDALKDPQRRTRIEEEVGDITIALLLFCDRVGIDLFDAAERKLAVNAVNYPVALSVGRSERPARAINDDQFSRVIAVDWSGKKDGGYDTIWMAEVRDGRVSVLENGRSREQVTDRLIEIAEEDPNTVIGLDFAFAFPAWFPMEKGCRDISELWRLVAAEGESWLKECSPPFWGRPGVTKPALSSHYRKTEETIGRQAGGQPKSVFQIGGAGAVGTGSLRGMPQLLRMRDAGLSIWPFDASARPFVVEIYPRLLTGTVVKSDLSARVAFLAENCPDMTPEMRLRAASTEDAFDAVISALVMWRYQHELTSLPGAPDGSESQMEGAIWAPRDAVSLRF